MRHISRRVLDQSKLLAGTILGPTSLKFVKAAAVIIPMVESLVPTRASVVIVGNLVFAPELRLSVKLSRAVLTELLRSPNVYAREGFMNHFNLLAFIAPSFF